VNGKELFVYLNRTSPSLDLCMTRFSRLNTQYVVQHRHLTRDAEAQELRGQLDRFETLLAALSSGQSIGTSAAGGMNGASGSGDGDVGENGAVHLLSQLSVRIFPSSSPSSSIN